jgi:hypothetical protein
MIVGLFLVFLPLHQGRAAHQDDVFARDGRREGARAQEQAAQKENGKQSFHRDTGSSIYAGSGLVASGAAISSPPHDLNPAPNPVL